jgi:hypothetical protein
MICKFNNFIIESIIEDIILESIVFKSDFTYILRDISKEASNGEDRIADVLLSLIGKDININQNYIGLSDEVDKITFIPEDKVKFDRVKVINGTVIDAGKPKVHQIVIDAGIPTDVGELVMLQPIDFSVNNIVNDWKLIKRYNLDDVTDTIFSGYILYHLQNNVDPSKFIVAYRHIRSDASEPIELIITTVGANKLKIGRYINRLLDLSLDKEQRKKYTAADIEKFVNLFISKMEFNKNSLDNFQIVKGEEIKKWYNGDKYFSKTGQLGQSCMQYDKCQNFFDIYIKNPDTCQLLILKDSTSDRILGRALLWKTDKGNCIDRVYTTKDSLIPLFDKWAKINNYKNAYKGEEVYNVQVEPTDYVKYPYMDTFKFYIMDKGILTNKQPKGDHLVLQSTDGDGYNS